MSSKFGTSLIAKLQKKWDLTILENHRRIALICHVTKLLDRMLLNMVRAGLDIRLQPYHYCFRPSRGAFHNVTLARRIIKEARRRQNTKVHGIFVYFTTKELFHLW